jgi:hypothetical protein
MNYAKFSKVPNAVEQLLEKLEILEHKNIVIEISNYPDYDISSYKREVVTDYFFWNTYNFQDTFSSLISADVVESYIFHYDGLQNLSQACKIPLSEDIKDVCSFLLQAQEKCREDFDSYKFDTEFDDFKLHELRIQSIDNLLHLLRYEGSFQGDSSSTDPLDWHIYATLEVEAIPKNINTLPFYKSLLAESYLLLNQGQYKLSYFLGFSAFESFINFQLGHEKVERLEDKLKELFRNKFMEISKHQIYTTLSGQFSAYVQERNSIAHGKELVIVSEIEARKLLLFVLTMIYVFENKVATFSEIGIASE